MGIKFKNPWGTSVMKGGKALDIQRSDLWALDLSESQSTLFGTDYASSNLVQALGKYYSDFNAQVGDLSSIAFYPKSVSFPEVRTNPEILPVYSTPYNFPGHDEAIPLVRVTFRHPSSELGKASAIFYILSRWRDICRAGRGVQFSASKVYANLGDDFTGITDREFMLKSALGYRVPYKYDMTLHLYRGNDYVSTATSLNINEMVPSSMYRLEGAWLSGIQLSDLDYESNVPLTIAASIYVDNITQVTTATQSEQSGNFWNADKSYVASVDPGIQSVPKPEVHNMPFVVATGKDIPPTPPKPEPSSIRAGSAVDASVPIWEHWDFWKRWK